MSSISLHEYRYNNGGVSCSFKDCNNSAFNTRGLIPLVRFYSYPTKHTVRCKEWIVRSGRDDFFDLDTNKLKCRRVCSKHFTPSQMIGMRLCHDAVPCVYYRDPNAAVDGEDSRSRPNYRGDMKLSENKSTEVTRSSDMRYYRPIPTSRRKPLETWDSKPELTRLDSNIDCETSNDRHLLENQIQVVGDLQNFEPSQDIMSVREISRLFSGCCVPYKLTNHLPIEPVVTLHVEASAIKTEPVEYDDAEEATDSLLHGRCDQLLQQVEKVTVKMEPIDYDDAMETTDSLLYRPCDPLLQVEKDTVTIKPIGYNDASEFTDTLLDGPPDPLLQQYSKQSSTILKTSFSNKFQQSPSLCSKVDKVAAQMQPIEYNDAQESTDSSLYKPPESYQQVEEVAVDTESLKYNNAKERAVELENSGIKTENCVAIEVDEYSCDDRSLDPDHVATKDEIRSVASNDPLVELSDEGDDSIESTAQCSRRTGGMSQRKLQMKRKHSGLSHITCSGKILKAIKHYTVIECCKRNCHDLLTADEQRKFYNLFRQSGDKQVQDMLLADSMKAMAVVTRRVSSKRTRRCSWRYFVPKKTEKMIVCRELFCKILQINIPRLVSVQDRLMRGESLMVENRGKYIIRLNKITKQVLDLIKLHWKDYRDGAIIIGHLTVQKLYQSFRRYYYDKCGHELGMKFRTYYAYYLQKKNWSCRPKLGNVPLLLGSISGQRKHRRKDSSSSESDIDSLENGAYDHGIDIKIDEIEPSSNSDANVASRSEKKETESKITEKEVCQLEEPTVQTVLDLGTGTLFVDLTNKENANCVGTSTDAEINIAVNTTVVNTTVDPDVAADRSVVTCDVVPEVVANGDDSELLDFFPYGKIDEDLTAVFANYFTSSCDDFAASDDDEVINVDNDDVHLRSRTYSKQLTKRLNWPRNSIQLQNVTSESSLCSADVCSSTDRLKLDWPLPGDSNFTDLEQQLVDRFIADGCGCTTVEGRSCSRLLTADQLLKYRQESAALDHYENHWNKLSLAVLAQLKALMYTDKSQKSGHKATVNYMLNGLVVCRRTFLFANRMKNKRYKRLISLYKENGLFIALHGNSKPNISANTSDNVINFLRNYASQSAVSLSSSSENDEPIQILPNCNTAAFIFSQFSNLLTKIPTLEWFVRTWKACCPETVVGHPSTDICRICSKNTDIVNRMTSASASVKFQSLENYRKHLEAVEEERENYRQIVKMTRESMNGNVGRLPNPSCCFSGSCHYSIGVVQNIHIPSNPAEPGLLNLLKPYQIGIFGIMCDSVAKQCNFLVPESITETITHNTIVNMLHYYFENYGYGEQNMYLHAYDGFFVSKNNTLLCYLSWRILKGLNKTINLSILPQGHSRLSCDLAFALFKDTFRKRFASSLNDVCNIMNESTSKSKLNFAVPTGTESGDILVPTFDWEIHFSKWQSHNVPNVTRYNHFHLSAEWPGKVKCKVRCNDDSVVDSVIMNLGMDHLSMPPEVEFTGLSNARKKYLFDNIREYCSPESKDALCPKPAVHVIDDDADDIEVTSD